MFHTTNFEQADSSTTPTNNPHASLYCDKSDSDTESESENNMDIVSDEKTDRISMQMTFTNPVWTSTSSATPVNIHDESSGDEDSGKPIDTPESEVIKWIRSRIKCRECISFTPEDSEKGENAIVTLCQCGLKYDDHSCEAKQNHLNTKWYYKTHSEQKMSNAFGEMEFVGYGEKVSKYVRVDKDTEMSDMLELMINVWGLEKPNLLISITGGAKNFEMSKRLKETFRRGLVKTAMAGAWIITGGTHSGLMKHVGEAVKDFDISSITQKPVVTIGIAAWGCVQNRNALIEENCRGLWPAQYRIQKEENPNETYLDPNHSHFILMDKGRQRFGVEIRFRAKLEQEIAKMRTDTDGVLVPIVLLVIEGGIGTLKTLHKAIQNKTPAVIVKGSGRVADILAYAYQNAREEEIEDENRKKTRRYMEDDLRQQVKDMLDRELPTHKDKHMTFIKDCLDNSDLISIFELDNTSGSREIDVSMLQALLKANKNEVIDQLRLALTWNRIDVAKDDIFTYDKRWPTGSLDDLVLSAIELNRTDFIVLFMDHGVSLREFLTEERLLLLYNKIPKESCLLRILLKNKISRKDFELQDVRYLLQDLMGDCLQYSNEHKPLKDVISTRKRRTEITTNFENPLQELFIWSVLMIRQDMAKLFWAEGKDAIAGALVAYCLLKAMQEKTEDTQLAIRIQENIEEWSNLAIGVLNECHWNDKKKAENLLVRKLGSWGDTTCLQIALKADNKEFISQTACQSLLNSIWFGKLTQGNHILKLLLCIFCPPFALWLVKYQRPAEDECTEIDQKEVRPKLGQHQTTKLLHSSTRYSRTSLKFEDDVKETKDKSKLRIQMHCVDKFCYFFNAPVIIFLYNVVSHMIFLSLFTYVLFDFNPKVSGVEIVLMFWVFTLWMEEIRQFTMTASSSWRAKLRIYINDKWNIVDLITIVLFTVGATLRFKMKTEEPCLFLAASFFMFSLRLLQIFSVHKQLGPKLVMIKRMFQDLMYFVVILFVFVISYAISSHSILFPNSQLNWKTFNTMMRLSYWNIFGEIGLEEIEGDGDCTSNETLWINDTYSRCPSHVGKYALPIMMGIYMLFTHVLLLNLLIAMFSYTFQKIQDNTDKHWCFQRYWLIYEYCTRPVLFPPLIVFAHIYLLVRCIFRCCSGDSCLGNNNEDYFSGRQFKNDPELVQWENVIADAFHHRREQQLSKSTDYKVSTTYERLNLLISRMDEIQEISDRRFTSVEKISPQLDRRLTSIEQQLEWIIKAMQASNTVPSMTHPTIFNLEKEKDK